MNITIALNDNAALAALFLSVAMVLVAMFIASALRKPPVIMSGSPNGRTRAEAASMVNLRTGVGPHTRIVGALRIYGPVKVDFLAKVLGRSKDELRRELSTLEYEGVLETTGVDEDETVALTEAHDN